MVTDRLRQVPLFTELSDDDLARICRDVSERDLAAGEYLFREGDPGDVAYFVLDGEVEIVKATAGRDTVVAVRGVGEVIGEGALLRAEPRSASVRARSAVSLLRIPRDGVDDLLKTSPAAARSLFNTLLDRMQQTGERLKQSERMAQLGTLTAGVAHELNNPAAAIQRSADHLGGALAMLVESLALASEPGSVLHAVEHLMATSGPPPTDALAASDAEAAVESWLSERGVDGGWAFAPSLVQAGLTAAALDAATHDLATDRIGPTVRLAAAAATSRRLAAEIAEAADRLSGIVGALRSYSHLDRAPLTNVDVHRGLDDTVTLLSHKLSGITVVRDYDPALPTITAMGGELNQVWTNLVANAADALAEAGTPEPTITIRTRRDADDVVVEIEDNGPGIPPEAHDRVFDAFYTTKEPGAGTGLGLQISHRIVVLDHRGTLTFESEPGGTVFRVVLPIVAPS